MDIVAIARYLACRCRIDSERGASLVEYAFLVGLIAMVCIVAVVFFGGATSSRYSNVASQVGGAGG
ncbi:MAG: Flp family type IVb pilin [Acidimicrobiia bacterium]|nr:Flp family type IVb pilin [Acidimicrobiia bacterium]MBV9412376.1 Flp family type IVb pilin [Acidimicrobiia bacterium]